MNVMAYSSQVRTLISLIQMEEWLKSLPQDPLPLYAIGPLGYGRPFVENSALEQSPVEKGVQIFLKKMQATHGEKSVVFVVVPAIKIRLCTT